MVLESAYGLRSPIVGEKFMSCAHLLTEGSDLDSEGDWEEEGSVWASVLQGGTIFCVYLYLLKVCHKKCFIYF